MGSVLIKNGTLIRADGDVQADVLIEDGIIENINIRSGEHVLAATGSEIIDATGKLLFPGFIDCHVHFREPGLTHKGTMATEAASARAGGVTTVCEMPNTNPPTVTVAALEEKVRIAKKIGDCDIRFYMGATEPRHLLALRDVWRMASPALAELKQRCCGLKLFLDHSTGNQGADHKTIEEAFKLCGDLGIPVIAHCEDPHMNALAAAGVKAKDVAAHSLRRPPESEAMAVEGAIALAAKYATLLHIAHLSTIGALEFVRDAKHHHHSVTCEVAPHHLFLSEDDYEELGTLGKMNPPLRNREHQAALWQGIVDGTVDCIATDHAPHTLEEKQSGDPLAAPSGVPGVETMIPLLLSVAAGQWPRGGKGVGGRGFGYGDILRLCFENPNRIFGLGKRGIEEGAPADIVLVDPNKEWTIEGTKLHSKCGWTPFEGGKVRGAISQTIR